MHKASEKGGHETALSDAVNVSMARFAEGLGVPSAITGRMVKTPPKQIVWLNSQDLKSMGVRMAGEPVQTGQVVTEGSSVDQIVGREFTSLTAITPQAKASTSAPSWNDFIEKVAKLSAEQNDGNAALSRLCQPELKNCILGLAYLLKDGRQGLAVVIQDLHGKTMRREVCEFNSSNEVRSCVDWDSGTKHRDLRTTKGDWVQITGE